MEHRSSHYWLWFLVFGVIAGLVAFKQDGKLDSESIWLLASGALGLILGANWLAEGKFARLYDFIIGAIFALVGVVGILGALGINLLSGLSSLPSGLVTHDHIIGLSVALLPSLIHLVLGLNSLNHGLKAKK